MKNLIHSAVQKLGFDIIRHKNTNSGSISYPPDFSKLDVEICNAVKPYTMTSPERVAALINSVRYVVKNNVKGAFVECGVWKGGSTIAMLLALKDLNEDRRNIYLYDTFSGMSAPRDEDISIIGTNALDKFAETKITNDSSDWCLSSLEEVKKNVLNTGYNKESLFFIEGKVEDTIPKNIPEEIAILRLDTDWYESTKHELTHLFPLLKPNGILIIDDYGHWEGARKAVDEYIKDNNIHILLNRIDYTGRIAVKANL